MANFKEVLLEALNRDVVTITSVNKNLMEIARSTKRKPGFLKVAVNDEDSLNYMRNQSVGFILHVNGDLLNSIAADIDARRPQAIESTESA